MELERDVLVSPTAEVPVVEGEVVPRFATLADRGVGKKAIARAVGVAREYGPAVSAAADRGGRPGPTGGAAADRRAAPRSADAVRRAGGRAMRSWCSACWPSVGSRSVSGPLSGRWPTFDASAGWRSSRRCASKRRRATSCKSISARSACRSPAPRCASSSWSRSSVTRAASSSKRSSVSARTTGAKGSPAAFTHFGGVPRTLLGDNARALVRRPRSRDRARSSFIRPIWPSAAIGTCSRARARRIGRGRKARPKRA